MSLTQVASKICIQPQWLKSDLTYACHPQIPAYNANGRSFFYWDAGQCGRLFLTPEVAKCFRKEAVPTFAFDNLTDEQE